MKQSSPGFVFWRNPWATDLTDAGKSDGSNAARLTGRCHAWKNTLAEASACSQRPGLNSVMPKLHGKGVLGVLGVSMSFNCGEFSSLTRALQCTTSFCSCRNRVSGRTTTDKTSDRRTERICRPPTVHSPTRRLIRGIAVFQSDPLTHGSGQPEPQDFPAISDRLCGACDACGAGGKTHRQQGSFRG